VNAWLDEARAAIARDADLDAVCYLLGVASESGARIEELADVVRRSSS
jgi:hypothetical protein